MFRDNLSRRDPGIAALDHAEIRPVDEFLCVDWWNAGTPPGGAFTAQYKQ
jgi:hypothetical protein